MQMILYGGVHHSPTSLMHLFKADCAMQPLLESNWYAMEFYLGVIAETQGNPFFGDHLDALPL